MILSNIVNTEAPQTSADMPVVLPMPDPLDRLKTAYNRERAKYIHDQAELDKVQREYEALVAEYEGIKAEIMERMNGYATRANEIQRLILEDLKDVNITGTPLPLKCG
jgi:hypothetical protein